MTFSLFTNHRTLFEVKSAKERVVIDALQKIANSEEYGKDAKSHMKYMKYLKGYNNIDNFIEVMYRRPSGNRGRLTNDISMCDEWGVVRGAICDELYFDIDGVNMGYQVFYQSYSVLTANDRSAKALTNIKTFLDSRDYYMGLVHDDYFQLYEKSESKYACKQLFIALLNGGSINEWKRRFGVKDMNRKIHSVIELLRKEIDYATKILFDYLPAFKIPSKKTPEKDTISHFIYSTELKCVEQLFIALGCPEYYMYCKDGLMVLKSDYTKSQIEKTIIPNAQRAIFEHYSLDIEFKIKPMETDIDIENLTPMENNNTYEIQKEKFEQRYCKVKDLNVFPYKSWRGEIKFHTESKLISAERDFCEKLKILKFKDGEYKMQEVRFIDEWLDDNDKKKYDDVEIYPSDIAHKCPSNIYNLWTPFLAESYEPCKDDELIDELEFLLNHILILCNHEKDIYNYFIRWFGQMLKFPSVKSTAPTFISEEGAGKGSLFELFRRVMGDNKVLETTKPEAIVGNHNTLLINSFLVIFNELDQSKIKQYGGDIKSFITDKSVQINPKGKDQFKMLSFHRLLNATNGENPIPHLHKNDRRNVIVRCSDELCKNQDYFNKFYECLDNTKLIRKFYDYCYNLDGLEKLELPPKTAHHEVLIDGNKCYITEFMKEKTYNWSAQKFTTREILPLQLYTEFKEWAEANGFKYETNTIHLVRKIGLLKIPKVNGKSKGARCITFNIDELIQFFNLKRNAEHDSILEDATTEEIAPLETIDKIVLPRPQEKIDMDKLKIILKPSEPEQYTESERDSFNTFLDNLMS